VGGTPSYENRRSIIAFGVRVMGEYFGHSSFVIFGSRAVRFRAPHRCRREGMLSAGLFKPSKP
jgi:hypothetical protein